MGGTTEMNGNKPVVIGIISMGIIALALAGILAIVCKDNMEVIKLVIPAVTTLTATAIAGLVGHLNTSKDDTVSKAAITLETGTPQITEGAK